MRQALVLALGTAFPLLAGAVDGALADPISVTGVFEFLDNRTVNDAGINPGTIVEFGASHVTPNGVQDTTGFATLPGFNSRPLTPQNYTVDSDFFSGGVTNSAAAQDSWT